MTGMGETSGRTAAFLEIAELLCRWVLGGLFIYAGAQKIADPYGFAKTVFGYGILPGELVNITAIVLPWIEVLAGGTLLAGVWPVSSAGVISGLLLMFLVALVANIARGYTFDCGCFGSGGEETTGWGTVFRDVAMLVPAAAVVLFKGRRRFCLFDGGE
ncbi:MauE/DoxX family redox-associated membrane protein [Desulfoluna butyratoxydans]|uniref:Methylamine utilisation protein maue n=1 Tax=Desulfoluna butyratoxydans TaxID=231438 RepID=A0A4U8YNQ3_9BACT|nr:MauE/DoxX family redox-associated membrane protein [Desulfoluna butyratoxydans]VFQ45254.1 methylamine utilisation protein maue [Desulfoluna butyratoxydans]